MAETDDNFVEFHDEEPQPKPKSAGKTLLIKIAVVGLVSLVILAVSLSIIFTSLGIVGFSRLFVTEGYSPGEPISIRGMLINEMSKFPVEETHIVVSLPGAHEFRSKPHNMPHISFRLPEDIKPSDKIRVSLVSELFRETLEIPVSSRSSFSFGELQKPYSAEGFLKGENVGSYHFIFEGGKMLKEARQKLWMFKEEGELIAEEIFMLEGHQSPKPFILKDERGDITVYLKAERFVAFADFLISTPVFYEIGSRKAVRVVIKSTRAGEYYINHFSKRGFRKTDNIEIKEYETAYELDGDFVDEGINCVAVSRNPVQAAHTLVKSCFFAYYRERGEPFALFYETMSEYGEPFISKLTEGAKKNLSVAEAFLNLFNPEALTLKTTIQTEAERKSTVENIRFSWLSKLYAFLLIVAALNVLIMGYFLIRHDQKLRRRELSHPHSRYHITGILLSVAIAWGLILWMLYRMWWGG